MQTPMIYNVFISHAWRYDKDYYTLEDRLFNTRDFKLKLFSNPENDPLLNPNDPFDKKYLFKDLEKQIHPAKCVLIIAGMYDRHRQWIQKEIDIAKNFRKPIIVIKNQGMNGIPKAIQNAAMEIVPIGDIKSVVKAIMNVINKEKKCA